MLIRDMLEHATKADIDEAYKILSHLWGLGYSPEDIITNVFRVCKSHGMAEFMKLEFIKEIGRTHLAMSQGCSSLLQLSGLLARLCQVSLAVVLYVSLGTHNSPRLPSTLCPTLHLLHIVMYLPRKPPFRPANHGNLLFLGKTIFAMAMP